MKYLGYDLDIHIFINTREQHQLFLIRTCFVKQMQGMRVRYAYSNPYSARAIVVVGPRIVCKHLPTCVFVVRK